MSCSHLADCGLYCSRDLVSEWGAWFGCWLSFVAPDLVGCLPFVRPGGECLFFNLSVGVGDGAEDVGFHTGSLRSLLCKSVGSLIALHVHVSGDPMDVTGDTTILQREEVASSCMHCTAAWLSQSIHTSDVRLGVCLVCFMASSAAFAMPSSFASITSFSNPRWYEAPTVVIQPVWSVGHVSWLSRYPEADVLEF